MYIQGVKCESRYTQCERMTCWVKYARCVPLYPLNPILTLYTTPKFGCIFRPQFSPDTVGRRRPALRLRSFPGRVPAAGENFFKKKSKWTIFFTKFVIFVVFTVYFGWKFVYFMKNIKFYQNLKNFRKFLKIFENFLIKNFFEKKFFFWQKKMKKM